MINLIIVSTGAVAAHIFPRMYFYPSVNKFTKLVPYAPMPKSEDIARRILCMSLYFTSSEEDIHRIVNIILS